MSEAQKYQGALYKEKPSKNAKKAVSIAEPPRRPLSAYVEDVPDVNDQALAIVEAPPHAPSPPPAVPAVPAAPAQQVNVFDFLVTEETPNASKVSLVPEEQMRMVKDAPSVFESSKQLAKLDNGSTYDVAYEENGYSYGSDPVIPGSYPANGTNPSMEYMTPAPKSKSKKKDKERSHKKHDSTTSLGTTSDKKRKRGYPENLEVDMTAVHRYELDASNNTSDAAMPDIDEPSSVPQLAHSGLTGGLNRLLPFSKNEFPPSPDYSPKEYDDGKEVVIHNGSSREIITSPLKRTRHSDRDSGRTSHRQTSYSTTTSTNTAGNGTVIVTKPRKNRIMSFLGGINPNTETALVRHRRDSSEADNRRAAKKVKHHRHHHKDDGHRKSSHQSPPRRKVKAIEYESQTSQEEAAHHGGELTLYGDGPDDKEKAELFLSFVTKGPDSGKGCSVHKALKRWRREVGGEEEKRKGKGREREEEELFRSLRLRRNERGEVVVFF